jgi:hypothetical protein
MFGTLMFPIVNIHEKPEVQMGRFFFYYVTLMVCVFKACDQWFKTFILLIASQAYFFHRFSQYALFNTQANEMIVALVYLNLVYAWHLWELEKSKKSSFSYKVKIRKSREEYQELLNNFPEGILIT